MKPCARRGTAPAMASSRLPIDRSFFSSLAAAAAKETTSRFRGAHAVENKEDGGFDPVTDADRGAEQAIRALIAKTYPDHRILGEEDGESGGPSPYRWVIDPVDGTRAFICGVPVWTTLVGLEEDGLPLAGLIDQPVLGERWIGIGGDATQFTDKTGTKRVHTSGCEAIADAKMMVTDIRPDAYFTEPQAAAVGKVANAARVLRQGLDSYGFGLVASGQMDLVVEASLSWYDIAAVIPVVEGAGGVAIDWKGEPLRADHFRGDVIIAATEGLGAAATEMLKAAL